MDDEALIDLQTRFAHQQDELDQLTRTVVEQHQQIDLLRAAVVNLQRQLQGLAEQIGDHEPGTEPPPPHY
jgi:SlyX protein